MSKGDKWRKTDFKNFFDNFDDIKFKSKSNKKTKDSEPSISRQKGKITFKYPST